MLIFSNMYVLKEIVYPFNTINRATQIPYMAIQCPNLVCKQVPVRLLSAC